MYAVGRPSSTGSSLDLCAKGPDCRPTSPPIHLVQSWRVADGTFIPALTPCCTSASALLPPLAQSRVTMKTTGGPMGLMLFEVPRRASVKEGTTTSEGTCRYTTSLAGSVFFLPYSSPSRPRCCFVTAGTTITSGRCMLHESLACRKLAHSSRVPFLCSRGCPSRMPPRGSSLNPTACIDLARRVRADVSPLLLICTP